MLDLRTTLKTASTLLKDNGIAHALIGGFAMAVHGINRATSDIDFLADGNRRSDIERIMSQNGFEVTHSSTEVLQFKGIGFVDILLANRPLSQRMLKNAKLVDDLLVQVLGVEDLIGLKIQAYSNDGSRALQDKSDIQLLMRKNPHLNWVVVKEYADLFSQWAEIEKLRSS